MANARDDIKWLFGDYRSSLPTNHQWEDEQERWQELVFCLLFESTSFNEADCRRIVGSLGVLNLLDPKRLAALTSDDKTTTPLAQSLRTVLVEQGLDETTASRVLRDIALVADAIHRRYGRLQQFLRNQGNAMAAELEQAFSELSMDNDARKRAVTLWLQNALEMPVPLNSLPMQAFCLQRGYEFEDLIAAADEQDVNVGVLDDLVTLAVARELDEAEPDDT